MEKIKVREGFGRSHGHIFLNITTLSNYLIGGVDGRVKNNSHNFGADMEEDS
ncbi:unnamed protein product [marine sediment metagenome]|uniref:Uncharacterized protein n=1 Tax=marine sediment metagenome TaxID=412755 RepID=X1J436_9ZZZZ